MFTGIIQGQGRVEAARPAKGGVAVEIEAGFSLDEAAEGESIAVNGACLTAYAIDGDRFRADISPESLARTTLSSLRAGSPVNLERALRLSDRLGGHIVSGHIDCVGHVTDIGRQGEFTTLTFSVPRNQDRYIIEKGSVAVDGISLTVNHCAAGSFSVYVIPVTMEVTTLGRLRTGGSVNVEVDVIGKYVEKLLGGKDGTDRGRSVIDHGYLAEKGFY